MQTKSIELTCQLINHILTLKMDYETPEDYLRITLGLPLTDAGESRRLYNTSVVLGNAESFGMTTAALNDVLQIEASLYRVHQAAFHSYMRTGYKFEIEEKDGKIYATRKQ